MIKNGTCQKWSLVTRARVPWQAAAKEKAAATKKSSSANASFFIMHRNKSIVPPTAGVKEHPEGPATALRSVKAVISGVLDSMDRVEMKNYIVRHGGQCVGSISKKVTHLLNDHGEIGPSKKNKCEGFGIPICSEDAIFALVATALAKASPDERAAIAARP